MFSRCKHFCKVTYFMDSMNTRSSNNIQCSNVLNSNLSFFQRKFSTLNENNTDENEVDIKAITNGNPELEHKLKVILLEAEVLRQEGKPVPPTSFFSVDRWKEILALPSRSARKKTYEFLFKLSKKKENETAKKMERRQRFEEYKTSMEGENRKELPLEEFVQRYDLQHNNMFLRIYESTMNQLYNSMLIRAIMFGQKLVVDCGYNNDMTKRENINCAKQLMLLFAENRIHEEPFDLHYCNANMDSLLIKQLNKHIPTMYEKWFPLNIHESSYLDLFPKEQLVYLTPHCREELKTFDHESVYIIGAIVDKVNNAPLSLAKAKKEGLRMAKLPLDKYLQWGEGSGKSLTLNQVASILLDVKFTGNWRHALRHVPKRKIVDYNVAENIRKSADSLRFDRPRKRWMPIDGVSFNNLIHQIKTRTEEREKDKFIDIKKIIDESV